MRSRAKTGSRPPPLTCASVVGEGLDRAAEAGIRPALQVAPGAVDLPGREAEPRGELAGTAALPGQLRHRAQLAGERGDHRHRVGAGGERVPQQHERLAVAAGDRGIGDREGVGLDPAARSSARRSASVISSLGVGEQLLAGGGELGEVVGERGDERAQGAPA